MKKILMLSIVLLAITVGSANAQKQYNIKTKKGKKFEIRLQENPTTGYYWELANVVPKGVVVLKKESFKIHNNHSEMVGVGGVKTYRFKAIRRGEAQIIFRLRRSGENLSAQKVYTVKV